MHLSPFHDSRVPRILQGQLINLWITRTSVQDQTLQFRIIDHRLIDFRFPYYHSQKLILPWNINNQPSPLLPIPLSLRFHNLVSHVPSQTCSPCTDIYHSNLSHSLSQSIRQNARADFQISLLLPSTDSNRCCRADNRARVTTEGSFEFSRTGCAPRAFQSPVGETPRRIMEEREDPLSGLERRGRDGWCIRGW